MKKTVLLLTASFLLLSSTLSKGQKVPYLPTFSAHEQLGTLPSGMEDLLNYMKEELDGKK